MTSHDRTTYWQQHIDQHVASGLSGTQYCQQAQLTYHCFSYWRRKLTTVIKEDSKPQAINAFVAVRPQSPPRTVNADFDEGNLQLVLPNGLIICNIQDGNLHTVRSLLGYL